MSEPGNEGLGGPDEDDSAPESVTPPHPLDRVWLHPSELPAKSEPEAANGRPWWQLVVALLGAAALGAVATVGVLTATGRFDAAELEAPVESVAVLAPAEEVDAREIAEVVGDAVVTVRTWGPEGGELVSGLAVRRDGEVLTSEAAVRDAQRISVTDDAGEEHPAAVAGSDPDSGLALLDVDATLRTARLVPGTLTRGDVVHAVSASTFGSDGPWVSKGIVSATDVRVATGEGLAATGLLATDLRPGATAAGGALVDQSGGVAGVVLPPVTDDLTTYAVPMHLALDLADELRTEGNVARGWLGLRGEDGPTGVVVLEVAARGPAARAGIEPGDVITTVDGEHVTRMLDLLAEIRANPPGTLVELSVVQSGVSTTVDLELSDDTSDVPDGPMMRPISVAR